MCSLIRCFDLSCVCTMRADDTDTDTDTATTFQTQESVQPFSTISDDAGPDVSTQRAVSLNCIIDVCRVLQCCWFRYLLYSRAICYIFTASSLQSRPWPCSVHSKVPENIVSTNSLGIFASRVPVGCLLPSPQ